MENSYGKETHSFADDIRKILILSFASYKKALLYAGYEEDKFDNWSLAAIFAKAHNMVPIHVTEGGKYLAVPDRISDLNYTQKQSKRMWDRASIKYCLNIEGMVKTLVCGAGMDSTFRRKENPAMLRSKMIESINGCDHAEYVRLRRVVLARLNDENTLPGHWRHRLSINAVFRKMALAEIRQDLSLAREQQNAEEIQAILERIGHLKWRHREELKQVPRSQNLQKLAEELVAREEMSRANPGLHWTLLKYAHG